MNWVVISTFCVIILCDCVIAWSDLLLECHFWGPFTHTKFSPLFSPRKSGLHRKKMEVFILQHFRPVDWAKWVADPFALKFFSLIQNNISPNFGDELNFVTWEHSLRSVTMYRPKTVAGPGGARDPPPSVQIISFSCSFWQHFCKIIGWRPPLGNPGSGTERIFVNIKSSVTCETIVFFVSRFN